MQQTVLVTGGAGYIGSHVVLALAEAGIGAVVLDDLSTGQRELVPPGVPFVAGDAGDSALVAALLRQHAVGAVVHLAASIFVAESVADPLKYYRNNTGVTQRLIETCLSCGVHRLVFSSSAAVYGAPSVVPIPEDAVCAPINPYGASKLASEFMLRHTAAASPLRCAILRYFNVAGADPAGRSGESTKGSTHLVKLACEVAVGRRACLDILGDDYDTPDGTCLRDYIHVSDLAELHLAALRQLASGQQEGESTEGEGGCLVLNCGYGRGFSVREIVAAVEQETGRPLPTRCGPRRPGDPAALIADVARLRATLDWTPRHADLHAILRSALAWERRLSGSDPASRAAQR
jgi:UDP-glucose 4-epimerase